MFLRKVERWTSKERRLSDCLGFHVVDLFYLSPFLLGLVSVPDYPFEKNRAAFVFNTLLTKPEVITVLSTVREECNRVAKTSLFHVSFTKSLSLEEFESAESQKHAQVYKLSPIHIQTRLCVIIHSLSSFRFNCFYKSHGWTLYVLGFRLVCMEVVTGTISLCPTGMFTICLNCVAWWHWYAAFSRTHSGSWCRTPWPA